MRAHSADLSASADRSASAEARSQLGTEAIEVCVDLSPHGTSGAWRTPRRSRRSGTLRRLARALNPICCDPQRTGAGRRPAVRRRSPGKIVTVSPETMQAFDALLAPAIREDQNAG